MKKAILIRKRKTRAGKALGNMKRAAGYAAAALVSAGILAGLISEMSLPAVQAAEETRLAVSLSSPLEMKETYIYHRHIDGSNVPRPGDYQAKEPEGCFREPVCHVHEGNETEQGGCYQIPVLHQHQGTAEDGGGCYGQPLYHTHKGDTSVGGDCYKPVYHTHTSGCYSTQTCTVDYTAGNVTSTWTAYCTHHQETLHGSCIATARHSTCDIGTQQEEVSYCIACGIVRSFHEIKVLTCSQGGKVIRYERNCEKEEGELEGYDLDCGKDGNTVDSYAPGCGSTEKTIEGYGVNCEWLKGNPMGKLMLTNESRGSQESVVLRLTFQDYTGGRLILEPKSCLWTGPGGEKLGTGFALQVSQNGIYTVMASIDEPDVNPDGHSLSLEVKNIVIPDPNGDSSEEGESDSTPDEDDSGDGSGQDQSGEGGQQSSNGAKPSSSPTATPTATPKLKSAAAPLTAKDRSEADKTRNMAAPTPSASPSPSPQLKKETGTVTVPQVKAEAEIPYEIEHLSGDQGFFSSPAVRMITLTLGAFLLLLGILLLLFYLRRSVKIFNDNGEGRLLYLGRCFVRIEEDGYSITISESMIEKSYTNRYCIKPGLFRLGRGCEEELFVCKEQMRKAVSLEKEIIVVI